MPPLPEAHTLTVAVARSCAEAYRLLVRPETWPDWASGLGRSIERVGEGWVAQTEGGPVGVRFTPSNDFGVLDHTVTLASGTEVTVPMRVVAHDAGCVVMLTLFRQPGMTDDIFARDRAWVERDLQALKALLEA